MFCKLGNRHILYIQKCRCRQHGRIENAQLTNAMPLFVILVMVMGKYLALQRPSCVLLTQQTGTTTSEQ